LFAAKNETVSKRARFSAGAIAEKVEDFEDGAFWVVSGGDVKWPKVYATSKETQTMNGNGILREWACGHVGQIEKMEASEPKFVLALACSTTILFDDKVMRFDDAWKAALASTKGLQMWGFYRASGAIDHETAGAKLTLSTINPCAVQPKETDTGLAKLLEAVAAGATLKTKARFISMWRVSAMEDAAVFAPIGVALMASKKITVRSKPFELTSNTI